MENKVLRSEWLTKDLTTTINCNEQPIEILQDLIDDLKKLGATHFTMEYSVWNEDTREVDFDGYNLYFETDEELKIRKEKEEFEQQLSAEKAKKQKEEQERLTYLKLKLKYENI